MVHKPPRQISPPGGDYDDASRRVAVWIDDNNAADVDETLYEFVVQAKKGRTVVLRRAYIDYLERSEPQPSGTVVQLSYEECGDASTPRYFTADLDNPRGRWRPANDDAGHPTPDFPYTVRNDDPEMFRLTAHTSKCDCRWRIALEWVSDGQVGVTYVIDEADTAFHTAPALDYPKIAWTCLNGPWESTDPT